MMNLFGFNPCFNGSWSERFIACLLIFHMLLCFNPCFNGSWSERKRFITKIGQINMVSILVLMEVGLRDGEFTD